VVSGAATGTLITVLAGREPGFVLGFFLVLGTIAASFAVRPGAVYRIFPVPALAYLGGAIIAGLIHDRAADTSHTALVINAAQWSASGFLAMAAATVLVAVVGAVRFWREWRRLGGTGPRSPVGPPGPASPRSQVNPRSRVSARGASDPRGASDRRSPVSSRSPASSRGTARPRGTGDTGGRRQSRPPGSGN
jgi:hypothetical protein